MTGQTAVPVRIRDHVLSVEPRAQRAVGLLTDGQLVQLAAEAETVTLEAVQSIVSTDGFPARLVHELQEHPA